MSETKSYSYYILQNQTTADVQGALNLLTQNKINDKVHLLRTDGNGKVEFFKPTFESTENKVNIIPSSGNDNSYPSIKAIRAYLANYVPQGQIITTYTNANKTPAALGGIQKGETFDNVLIQDMFTKLLYPYIEPKIKNVKITPECYVYKIGDSVTITNVSADLQKGSEKITAVKLFDDLDDPAVISETGEDLSAIQFDCNIQITTATNRVLTVEITDARGNSYTANTKPITFVNPYYYGEVSNNAAINENEILKLNPLVEKKGTKTVIYDTDGESKKMVFASPYVISRIIDQNNFDVTTDFEMRDDLSTGLDNYYTYVATKPAVVSNFKMTFEN